VKASQIYAIGIAGACVLVATSVALAGLLAWGAVPTVTELFGWLAVIALLGGVCIYQGNRLHSRTSDLEHWASSLEYRSKILDDFDKNLKRREWAVIWGEAKTR
jgi:hypothetical protein